MARCSMVATSNLHKGRRAKADEHEVGSTMREKWGKHV